MNENKTRLWKNLIEERKCLWCKMKFPDGIITPRPKVKDLFVTYLTPEFKFHAKTTHGYPSEILQEFWEAAVLSTETC